MRLCVAVPCFFGGIPFSDAIRKIASLGFDAAETYDWTHLDLNEARAVCDGTGVELLSMCTTDFRVNEPAHRDEFLDGLKRSCDAAQKLGVRRLITQGGQDTGEERVRQHAAIVETLSMAAPLLSSAGVVLMLEPLNALVDHKGTYLTSSGEAFDIVRAAGSPYVKVIYDIYHQQVTEGNIIPQVTSHLDLIAHLHAAGHPGRHELQDGELNYRYVFAALDAAGYAGACGLEYGPRMAPVESLTTAKRMFG